MTAGVATTKPHVDIEITVQNPELTTGVHVSGDQVQIVFAEGQIVEEDWHVYVAAYSKTGQMLAIAPADQNGKIYEARLSGAASAYEVRVFVLKDDYTPAWERLSTLDQKEGE